VELLKGLYSKDRLLVTEGKWLAMINTLAYYGTVINTVHHSPLALTFYRRYYHNKLECLSLSFTSTLVLYLQAKLEVAKVEPHSNGSLLVLSTNIRLGCKWLAVTNSLAYYVTVINIIQQGQRESHSNGRLPAVHKNNRLGCKRLAVTNTLAYHGTQIITATKCFIVQAVIKYLN
jgi:hypothetical protein